MNFMIVTCAITSIVMICRKTLKKQEQRQILSVCNLILCFILTYIYIYIEREREREREGEREGERESKKMPGWTTSDVKKIENLIKMFRSETFFNY